MDPDKTIAKYPDRNGRLPAENGTIRLLQINRSHKSTIVCTLERHSLDSKTCPKFTTISYVWGTYAPEDKIDITVNGVKFPVAPSVPPILELIRDHGDLRQKKWIWIDGICINQSDAIEKNHQVDLMGRIYSESEHTIAWLGKRDKNTDASMDLLVDIQSRAGKLQRDHKARKPRQTPADLQDAAKWKPLRCFFGLPWWRRVWTLQEFILARKLTFYWGDRSITRRDFKAAVNAIWICNPGELLPFQTWRPAWHRRRMDQWYLKRDKVGKKSLLAWMAYNSALEVSDERDRIYGVRDLVNDVDRSMIGTPNYEDDTTTLYRKLVMSWVKTHNSLDIICFSHIFGSHCQSQGSGRQEELLPSWVPDWRRSTDTFVVPLMVSQCGKKAIGNFRPVSAQRHIAVYSASGMSTPIIRGRSDPDQLPCEGFLIDTIDGLGDLWNGETNFIQSKSSQNTIPQDLIGITSTSNISSTMSAGGAKLLDDIVRCLVLDRKDRQLGAPAPIEQFRTDFLKLATSNQEQITAPVHKEFGQWFQRNKGLLIRGVTLEQLCRATKRLPSSKDNVGGGEESFAGRAWDTTGLEQMARRLVTTQQGLLGMAPARSENGDAICVLKGCSVPVILRKRPNHSEKKTWEFIGECYVPGFMNGEVLDSGCSPEEFIMS
jgi:hypothetical protein